MSPQLLHRMERTGFALLLMTSLCVSTFSTSHAAEPFGTALGNNSGVTGYSNGSTNFNSGQTLASCGVSGLKWQCVEYVRRWLGSEVGVCMGSVSIAADIWNITTVTDASDGHSIAFDSYSNGGTTAPLYGDLLVYNTSVNGTGHVAAIVEVSTSGGYIRVAEQNWNNTFWPGDYSRQLTLTVSSGHYTVSGSGINGWKRARGAVSTGTTQTSWLFNTDGNTSGWTANNVAAQLVSGSNWIVNPNNDPQLISPLLSRAPSSINFLRIGVKNKGGDESGEIFFSGPGFGYAASRSRAFTNPNNGGFNWITVRLDDIANWNSPSNIDHIRIDPVHNGVPVNGNDDVLTDYIFLRKDATNPTAPEILSVTPSSWTNINSFSITFRGNDPPPEGHTVDPVGPDVYGSGVSDFRYHLDEGPDTQKFPDTFDPSSGWATATVNVAVGHDGNTVFHVYSFDKVARAGQDNTTLLHFDGTPPSTPAIVGVTPSGWTQTNGFTVSWTTATDATSGLNRYQWRLDGGVPNDCAGTSVSFSAPSSGTHSFEVRAVDNAGNAGSWSGIATIYWDAIGPNAPSITNVSPSGWTPKNGFSFSWSNPGDAQSGLSHFDWIVDGGTPTSTAVTSVTDVQAAAPGAHHFQVRGVDNVGNAGAWSTQADFLFDPNPPSTEIGVSSANADSARLEWHGADSESGIADFDTEYRDSIYADWSPWQTGTADTSAVFGPSTPVHVLSGHTYFVRVRATDVAGNIGQFTEPIPIRQEHSLVAVGEGPIVPKTLRLYLGGPNPVSSNIDVCFDLPRPAAPTLQLFDVSGRRVATLVASEPLPAGTYHRRWSCRDDGGHRVRSGVYFAAMAVNGHSLTTRIVVVQNE